MANNVAKGDLAMVVDCPTWGFNGATCRVLQAVAGVQCACGRPIWFVKFGRTMPWVFQSPLDREGKIGMMPDCQLRKLSGPDLEREVFEEQARDVVETLRSVREILGVPQ